MRWNQAVGMFCMFFAGMFGMGIFGMAYPEIYVASIGAGIFVFIGFTFLEWGGEK